ncbi:MAG: hypothetical protein ACOX9E_00320 [Lentisphaeria bacterium]|jgi:hypothetical protein
MASCLAAARQFTPPVFFSRAGAKFFYPQITQIVADYGVVSCRCAAIHAAGFFSHAPARSFFIRRLRRLSQIMASCLAAARPFTPPVFYPQIKADSRRLFLGVGCLVLDRACVSALILFHAEARSFFIRRLSQIMASCLAAARPFTPPVFFSRDGDPSDPSDPSDPPDLTDQTDQTDQAAGSVCSTREKPAGAAACRASHAILQVFAKSYNRRRRTVSTGVYFAFSAAVD